MPDRAFIDSNIWLYAFNKSDETKHLKSKKLISQATNITISSQVVNEVSKNLLYKFRFTEDRIRSIVESMYESYTVLDISKTTIIKASELRERYNFSYFDSLIVSSALLYGCSVLYSEDMQDGLVVDGLKISNPF